ncbi:MAG: BatA domain-containing protein, partial [Clostridia bacterium]|nr:BatA domain-containing protein [Clostridia bacterium]
MSLLTPIGLLGLIGLIILIIIYIIKPNYQNKFISSTYVWQLSLKFQKKKIPLSNIRNILIFICQVLAIVSCALILTQPFIQAEKEETVKEKIVIIDASASMLTKTDGVTRFERAI